MRSLLALPLALGAAAIVAVTAGAATPAQTLNGSVGPGFTITLKQGGSKVKTLKAGTYKLVVTDKATIHNFELEGPGVKNVETDVSEKGTKSFALKLKKGTYTFYCKPHESSMRGTFTVK